MFWTKWVRGFCKVFLFISILGSLIGGISLIAIDDDLAVIGIITAVGGVLLSVSGIALIMMISEISLNINEMRSVSLSGTEKGIAGKTASEPSIKKSEQSSADIWFCSCGCKNSVSDKYCRKCGNDNHSYRPQISKSQLDYPQGTWFCPVCGMANPNSSRVCKDCAYQK